MIDIVDLFNACLYIQDHLDADLSLMFLAQTVGLSRFRFHRVFKAWRGETLHDFVTRMRMERAAFELRYPIPLSNRRSIKAIAFASGYKSLSSFSHAFSSYSRLSPREFRNQALRLKPESMQENDAARPFSSFSISVADQPERRIAVLESTTPSSDRARFSTLERISLASPIDGDRYGVELLPNLVARSGGISSRPSRVARLGCVGVAIDDWIASGGDVRGASGPRSSIRLNAGRYAVLEGDGSLIALYRAWRRGFDQWLALTGECPRSGRAYLRFPNDQGPDRDLRNIALYIPLEDPATQSRRRRQPGTYGMSVGAP